MGREYNNKRSSRARASAPNQFLVVIITFLLGYFTATIFDLDTVTRWVDAQILSHQDKNKTEAKAAEPKQAAIPPKTKFEFYTLLANEKVPNSEKNAPTTQPATPATTNPLTSAQTAATTAAQANTPRVAAPQPMVATKPPPTPAASKGAYSIQVASFKARQDAEHMKGALTLKGFNVTVVPINHATRGSWFRVVVGPYASKELAEKARIDIARSERLQGMLTAG